MYSVVAGLYLPLIFRGVHRGERRTYTQLLAPASLPLQTGMSVIISDKTRDPQFKDCPREGRRGDETFTENCQPAVYPNFPSQYKHR
jgi:hypothetical protein